ncbi:MAG: ArnT family glycosyltransferase [Flavitalea sp.]
MRFFLERYHRPAFFITWFLINLIQAAFTGLMDDEAYYWVYSQYPAWGYFDHPPMIAWLIKAGSMIFNGTLGVRFFIVLLNTLTLLLISNLLEKKNDYLFYAIAGSLMVAQIGGIIAVPDLPLLFFTSLFFLLYKRFISHTNFLNAILLGTGIALMLYSKYHGVLIVFFTLLSNIKLLAKYQTYIVAAVTLLLFAPHIFWQIEHDLPSIQYHLIERNASEYRIRYTSEYVFGQFALAGPIVGWLLLYAAFNYKSNSVSERALKFSMVGIYAFFLVSTFKGRVEANWTVPAFIGLIVLSHQFLIDKPNFQKWLYRLLPISLILVLVVRIFMGAPVSRVNEISKDEFHGNKEWVAEVNSKSNGLPVVFIDSYQSPSKYMFYSGNISLGLNTVQYRRNNYNYWPIEDSLIGKKVIVIGAKDSLLTGNFQHAYLEKSGYRIIDNYFSFSKVQLKDLELSGNKLSFLAKSPANYLSLFKNPEYANVKILFAVITPDVRVEYIATGLSVSDIQNEEQQFNIDFPLNFKEGQLVKLAIESSVDPSLNSISIK